CEPAGGPEGLRQAAHESAPRPPPPLVASEEVRGAHATPLASPDQRRLADVLRSRMTPRYSERSRLTPSNSHAQQRSLQDAAADSQAAEFVGHCPRLSIGESPSSTHAHACRYPPGR